MLLHPKCPCTSLYLVTALTVFSTLIVTLSILTLNLYQFLEVKFYKSVRTLSATGGIRKWCKHLANQCIKINLDYHHYVNEENLYNSIIKYYFFLLISKFCTEQHSRNGQLFLSQKVLNYIMHRRKKPA